MCTCVCEWVGCQVNPEVMFAMYLLIVSSVCWKRAGHKAVRCIFTSSPSYKEQKLCCRKIMWLCVGSTLIMWSELRAGSKKCWVALQGSFHLGNRHTASVQAERGDGRPDGRMDGCWTEKRCGREPETGRESERSRKHPVALFYHGETAPASFFHSPHHLCGFFKQPPSKHANLHFESHWLFCGKASLDFFPYWFGSVWWQRWPVRMTLLYLVKYWDSPQTRKTSVKEYYSSVLTVIIKR